MVKRISKRKMRLITIHLPENMIEEIDNIVRTTSLFNSRSEFIRHAVVEYLLKVKKQYSMFKGMVIG